MAEYDDWEEHWMTDLQDTCFEMLDALHHIGTSGALGVPGRDGIVHIVGEGEFPTASEALLANIALPIDNL